MQFHECGYGTLLHVAVFSPTINLCGYGTLLHVVVFSWSVGGDGQWTGRRRSTVGQLLVCNRQHGTAGTVYGRSSVS